jgi:O-acetyl-ADP-ribose deacetylase (regulator of RNase III)
MVLVQKCGDVLSSSANVIAHQVNAMGVMGAGLAKQIRTKYFYVFNTYKTFCEVNSRSRSLLGKCLLVPVKEQQYIANLFGQYNYGTGSRKTDYEAVSKALESCKAQMQGRNLKSIAFPYKMSSGLAGGDWNVIYSLIEDVFISNDYTVEIWRFGF